MAGKVDGAIDEMGIAKMDGKEEMEGAGEDKRVAVPPEQGNKEDIRPKDYTFTRINLGPTSKEQEIEEFKGSVSSILNRLNKDVLTSNS